MAKNSQTARITALERQVKQLTSAVNRMHEMMVHKALDDLETAVSNVSPKTVELIKKHHARDI